MTQKGSIQIIAIIGIVIILAIGYFSLLKTSSKPKTLENTKSSKITTEQARMVVQNLPEVQQFLKDVPNGKVEIDNENEGQYNVHVYEVKNGHTATFNWYKVNTKTGKPKAQFDLSKAEETSTAKGVVIVKSPVKGEKIKSPLTVTGFVYGNNGTLTIKLKQKDSGQYVTEDKVVKIEGKSDQISFAESLQFGLPAMPQTGVLEIEYTDKSGKGLDDKVQIEVKFPSDLGKGT